MPRGIEVGRGYIAVDLEDSSAKAALSSFGSFAADSLKKVALVAGVVSGAAIKMAFDFNSLKEQSLIAFGTLLKSGDKAQAMFTNLQKFAAATPFELPGLIDNARQLLGVGVAADKVIPTLTALGDTAGALGINQDHFNNILLATTQAMGKGKLQGEELMQMVENGIPVWQLLSEATGKPIPELQKLSSTGKLLSKDVLPQLFAQMEKDYGGAMAKQALTLTGVWSSLKDNTKSLLGSALEPLFTTVKKGIGALGDLAQSSAAQDFAKNFAAGLQTAITWSGNFYDSVKEKFGPQIRSAFDSVKTSAGHMWDSFKSDGVPILKDIGKGLVDLAPDALKLAQALGGLLQPAMEAIKTVLTAVSGNMGNFQQLLSTAASVASAVAGPAIKVFGEILKVAAAIISDLINLVGDLATPLGVVAGLALSAMAAWRLFAPAITAVGAAFSALRPSAVADALTPMAKRIDNVALSAGVMTEKLTKSGDAGEKVATAGSRVGTALKGVGAYLPIVGVGIAALGILFEQSGKKAEELHQAALNIGKGLAIGGSAAVDAGKKLADLQKQADEAKTKLDALKASTANSPSSGRFSAGSVTQANQTEEYKNLAGAVATAQKAVSDYRAELGPVGISQARVAQAQADYNSALVNFGTGSAEALFAQRALTVETRGLDQAQRDAAQATKTHEQSLYDLASAALAGANADLQLRQSQQGYKESLDALVKVQHDGKASSDDLTNAQLALESAGLRSAQAAMAKAQAENAGKSASDIATAGTKAYYNEIGRLIIASGDNAPPALQKLIGNMDASSVAALGAKVSIDKAGNAVVTLPDGKEIHITAENAGALGEIAKVQAGLIEAQKHAQITITARLEKGLPAISDLKMKARGGTVSDNTPYIVGEEGPEIFYPNTTGFIANHKTSMSEVAKAASTGSGGDTWNIYEQADPYSTAMNVQRIQQFNGRLK